MTVESLFIFLLIGAVAGWAAGMIVKGYGFGLLGNIVVGVLGSFVGGWLFARFVPMHQFGAAQPLIGATVGAVILLLLVRFVRRAA